MDFHVKPGEYDAINYIPHTESHGTKELWRTFWLLLGITILDFVIYFVMPATGLRNFIFIFFGLVKAYYIVGAFMHLKHEKINLALIILVPTIFIVGLIMGLLYEGNALTWVK
ncbi:MAG: cytochrome C oxidase subunit IV family protein [Bacteroidetes bacterium]|jgi:cytochrome c oxidase subunit 4|nr:cytochrome C oxidase subunit IV family protein [Bacteroidota bacterium]MDA0943412.1 cytochrome C oxidase subunit IV family protein [Bacteroidota bacterium]MDA1111729.1 cytochrome C oxidase subunit IV family protein [Bacteroidota bacterium]